MKVFRTQQNPIITPQDVIPSRPDFEVVCAFNAGVIRFNDEIVLLLRIAERPMNNHGGIELCAVYDCDKDEIEIKSFDKSDKTCDFSDSRAVVTPNGTYLTSISHLRIARSHDGINFSIENAPALAARNKYEAYGVEDPRITQIGNIFYINYSAVSRYGINTSLVSTEDFKTFTRHGNIFCPDNKDVTIFPDKINGKYYALHRPSASAFAKPEIWIAESDNLMYWGNHRHLLGSRKDSWDSSRIGASAVPFKVDGGWLEIYHGATNDNIYCLGAVLLDDEQPWKVLARSEQPIMKPEESYEVNGFFGNVVFSCGALNEDGKIKIYYGAADTCTAYAEVMLDDIMDSLGSP